ncbi:MAG: ATP-dependent helicase, partial [Promicromonosporaceae bacterium]|nr:ATP-dependent helicase [Promicromonosporaceae bacterium]
MEQLDPDAILEFLDPEQRAVAGCLQGPMVVLAGAGTGKTRAITHRIAYGIRTGRFKSSSVLAVTFTARAAGEMRLRLKGLGAPGVNAKTFHAAALKQLKYFWPQAIGGPMPDLIESKGRYLGEAARHIGLKVDSVSIRDIAREIEWAKVSLINPEDYVLRAAELGRDPISGFTPEQIGALALGYENIKEKRGLIDFEDILAQLGGILAENTVITDMVRRQYQHFVVDEYQDVSPLQQYVLDQWLGDRENLCVVGDPSQTIYSFTGATPDYLLGFRGKYPQATEIRLV